MKKTDRKKVKQAILLRALLDRKREGNSKEDYLNVTLKDISISCYQK